MNADYDTHSFWRTRALLARTIDSEIQIQASERSYGFPRVNATFPVEAPPAHVALRLPVGQTARAARTHCSQRPLDMLRVAPAETAFSENFAVPDCPTVEVGFPPHFVIVPAMPPQMPSSATFWSWKTIFLDGREQDGKEHEWGCEWFYTL